MTRHIVDGLLRSCQELLAGHVASMLPAENIWAAGRVRVRNSGVGRVVSAGLSSNVCISEWTRFPPAVSGGTASLSEVVPGRDDILHAVNGAVSRVERIEDSRPSQFSDLLSVGIL